MWQENTREAVGGLLDLFVLLVSQTDSKDSDGKKSAGNAGDQLQSLGWEDPLEKETAAHSSILAQRIPWTEEPGRVIKSQTGLSD